MTVAIPSTVRPDEGARRPDPARAAVMQAIKLLLLRNADVVDVDAALKRDVALSVKLLRYMNTAGMGPGTRVESLKHAIALLGYNRLARWLTLLLATAGSTDPTAPLLARTAITRGRLIGAARGRAVRHPPARRPVAVRWRSRPRP